MGTNFYWLEPADRCPHCDKEIGEPNEGEHIGKRSAAGFYCYDCDRTLVCDSVDRIHYASGPAKYTTCPKCGKAPVPSEGLKRGPVAVELGFAQPEQERPKGVDGASSFSWAQDPAAVRARCETSIDKPAVIDEYGRTMTGGEFLRMLKANCPIEFTDSIGSSFC